MKVQIETQDTMERLARMLARETLRDDATPEQIRYAMDELIAAYPSVDALVQAIRVYAETGAY